MENAGPEARTAPYLPWRTFLNFLLRLEGEATLPNRIDRSYLRGMSGADQSQLMVALKAFGLVGENGKIEQELVELATDPDGRPKRIGEMVRRFYPAEVKLGAENGTPKQLEDSFEESFSLTGSTRQKAIRFFLSAAQFGDVDLSPHFSVPAAPRGRSVRRRSSGSSGSGGGGKAGRGTVTPPSGGDASSVRLPSGAVLTLTVSQTVLSLQREDRNFILGLVDQMQDYGDAQEADEEDEEGGQI